MKKFLLLAFIVSSFQLSFAQNSPVDYLNKLSNDNETIMNNTWRYLSAIAKNRNAKRIEKRRVKLEAEIRNSYNRIKAMKAYNGDKALRDSTISYYKLSLDVMTGKTKELINLEEISEKSYDNMEAYIFYQEEINKKLRDKGNMLEDEQKRFATANNVNLIESEESDIAKKIEKTSKVLWYKNLLYLAFFRCAVYEGAMLEATQHENSNFNFQEAGLLLTQLVDESKSKMDTITDVNKDLSLRKKTEQALDFFSQEADELVPTMVKYRKAKTEMDAITKKINNTPKKKKTKEMIDDYNKKVAEMNKIANKLNRINDSYNNRRNAIFQGWNKTANDFVNRHAPTDN